MLLDADHQMIRDAVRDFVQAEIAPHAASWAQQSRFPREALEGLAALGCLGIAVPAAWDGAGLDYLALALAIEEIAAGDGATSTVVSVNNCPVCSILMTWGSEAQKQRWLKPVARGAMIGAFALSEPQAGSDASNLRTTARRDGDDYVLDGVKQFITSGKNGQVAIVLAATDRAAGKHGISAFIVPTDAPGYIVERLEHKAGQAASDTAQIRLQGCRVPASERIGEEGQGYKIALSGLEGGRIGIASQAVGMARAAFEAALDYSPPPDLLDQLTQDLLRNRNRHLLKEIQTWLPRSDDLVVPWGVAHMPQISKEIQKSGFHLVKTKEYTLIRFHFFEKKSRGNGRGTTTGKSESH